MSDHGSGRGKVVMNRVMSLDGYIAGPDNAMEWIFDYLAGDEFPEIMEATGALLAGRKTYEVGRRDTGKPSGEFYGGALVVPQFVLTHRPPKDVRDGSVTFLTGDIETAVATAQEAAGGKSLEILGADVSGQCLQRGLIDEILVHVLPVLLGSGTPLLSHPSLSRVDLEPLTTTRRASVTTLRFRIPKSTV